MDKTQEIALKVLDHKKKIVGLLVLSFFAKKGYDGYKWAKPYIDTFMTLRKEGLGGMVKGEEGGAVEG
jgi:hypothetical protein